MNTYMVSLIQLLVACLCCIANQALILEVTTLPPQDIDYVALEVRGVKNTLLVYISDIFFSLGSSTLIMASVTISLHWLQFALTNASQNRIMGRSSSIRMRSQYYRVAVIFEVFLAMATILTNSLGLYAMTTLLFLICVGVVLALYILGTWWMRRVLFHALKLKFQPAFLLLYRIVWRTTCFIAVISACSLALGSASCALSGSPGWKELTPPNQVSVTLILPQLQLLLMVAYLVIILHYLRAMRRLSHDIPKAQSMAPPCPFAGRQVQQRQDDQARGCDDGERDSGAVKD